MKRREMIAKIESALNNTEGLVTRRLQAEVLLDLVEEAGMLPPVLKIKTRDVSYDGSSKTWVEENIPVHSWDGE